MTENRAEEIDVDAIMKQIRTEVARRKAEAPQPRKQDQFICRAAPLPVVGPEVQESKLFRFAKKIQAKLRGYPFFDLVNNAAKSLKKFIPKHRNRLAVSDFMRYHDREFIQNAFRGICKREADAQGLESYLSRLRDGRLSKIEVLGRIRYSTEGRSKEVAVKGLFPRFAIRSTYRVPVIGYLISFITAFLRFPGIVRDIGIYEATTNANFTRQADSLSSLSSQVHVLSKDLNSKITGLEENKAERQFVTVLADEVRDQKTSINDLEGSLRLLFDEMRKSLSTPMDRDQVKGMLAEEDHLLDTLYVVFEDRFRGSREVIKERSKEYLPYIERARIAVGDGSILDIGCGRGEWLELLRENNHTAKGIDLNRTMAQQCRERGLDVAEADAIRYLREQQPDTFSAITGFHIVEHLPFKTLIQLFDEALRTLKPGGVVIFETPNPENLIVGACNFYLDPTHRNPVPPQLLHFVAEARKFEKSEILRVHPFDFFKDATTALPVPEELRTLFTTGLDYSLIAYKPARYI